MDNKVEIFTWADFDSAVDYLATMLKVYKSLQDIYGIPRGGLPLAVALSHRLDLPLTTVPTPETLVVDDISDSGATLSRVPKPVWGVATIHYVTTSHVKPDFYYKVRQADWVIYPWERK